MSVEKFVETLGKQIGRRKFLVKAGAGIVGGSLALMDLSQPVGAVSYRCCNLCNSPGSGCWNCQCAWCWQCCDYNYSPPQQLRCCECYDYTGCNGSCPAKCSWVESTGSICPYRVTSR